MNIEDIEQAIYERTQEFVPQCVYKAILELIATEHQQTIEANSREIERLTELCYDYLGQLTALRAAKQMQEQIDSLKEKNT